MRGNRQAWRLIESLWDLAPRGHGTDFEPALELLRSNLGHTALVLCLSDFIAAESLWHSPYLRSIAHKVDFVPVIVDDSWEEALPQTSGYVRLKDAEGGQEMVLALSPKRCRQYRSVLEDRREEVRKRLYGASLDHITLRSGEDYLKRILGFFGTRKRRR
jgi:hypothetical protein